MPALVSTAPPTWVEMGVGQDDEVNGGRLDAGGLETGRETACRGLRPAAASGVDEHAPVSSVHQNDIDLDTKVSIWTRKVSAPMWFAFTNSFSSASGRFVASKGLGNVNEPSLSTVISKEPSFKR